MRLFRVLPFLFAKKAVNLRKEKKWLYTQLRTALPLPLCWVWQHVTTHKTQQQQ